MGLAFDAEGLLYVDRPQRRLAEVEVIDRTANARPHASARTKRSRFPNGIAVDKAGNVYVTDSNNGRLLVFDPDGKRRGPQVGRGAGEGNLGLPRGVAVDDSGRVYVGDTTGQGVFVYRTLTGRRAAASTSSASSAARASATGSSSSPTASPWTTADASTSPTPVNDRVQVWSY